MRLNWGNMPKNRRGEFTFGELVCTLIWIMAMTLLGLAAWAPKLFEDVRSIIN